jgi:hypothetical protein
LGKTYEFQGYEAGMYRGIPNELREKPGMPLQSPFFRFQPEFRVYQGRQIAPLHFVPSQFFDRRALIRGKAANREGTACIEHDGWTLVAQESSPWPTWAEGKLAEIVGVIRKTDEPMVFRAEGGLAHLSRLEDQVGHEVELRGHACEVNNDWSFYYHERRVWVDDFSAAPGWQKEQRDYALCGILEKVSEPVPDGLAPGVRSTVEELSRQLHGHFHETKRETWDRYFVRNPRLRVISDLLPVELLGDEFCRGEQ